MPPRRKRIIIGFGKALLWLLVAELLALILNFTGDCDPGTQGCGEIPRAISFVVLGIGISGAVYTIWRSIFPQLR